MQNADATSSLVQVITPDIIVHSGIRDLDRFLGGFKAGDMTLIDGNCRLIADLPNHLCVNTYRTFHSDTIYIDGGMSANPYQIARYARLLELDQRETLEHVVVSRAFTVYQLSTLVQDLLEPLLKSKSPRTLIIGIGFGILRWRGGRQFCKFQKVDYSIGCAARNYLSSAGRDGGNFRAAAKHINVRPCNCRARNLDGDFI